MMDENNHIRAASSNAVQIRLKRLDDGPANSGGNSNEELLQDITIKLSRQASKEPSNVSHTRKNPKAAPISTARILAQISSLLVAIFIGLNFGGLMCLAFLLFFCLPVATSHWAVPDEKDTPTKRPFKFLA
jgi:hypothetical protein